MISDARYLDTAAVSSAARAGSGLSLASAPLSDSPREVCLPEGVGMFFAPNATLAMLSIIEQRVLYAEHRWKEDSQPLHPVVRSALKPLSQRSSLGGPRVYIRTINNWVTGERWYPDSIFPEDIGASDLLVVDAVQSFGTLAADEVGKLLDSVHRGAVVVGCLHKWLGSPLPLGFGILPRELLQDARLRGYLAARDYMGLSLGVREGFEGFPDTYAATLAPLFSPLLRIAFGLDREALKSSVSIVRRNRDLLAQAVLQNSQFRIIGTSGECRAIVAAYALSATAEAISARLLEAGFIHTLFREHPSSGRATLRLSAPLVEIDSDSFRLLDSILTSSL